MDHARFAAGSIGLRVLGVALVLVCLGVQCKAQEIVAECPAKVGIRCSSEANATQAWGTTACVGDAYDSCKTCTDGCLQCAGSQCVACHDSYRLSPVSIFDAVSFRFETTTICLPRQGTATIRIDNGRADGQESFSGSFLVDIDDAALDLGSAIVALQFRDVPVPPRSRIIDARLQLTAAANSTSATSVDVYVMADSEMTPLRTRRGRDISSRSPISPATAWDITSSWMEGAVYTSPSLKQSLALLLSTLTGDSSFNVMVVIQPVSGASRPVAAFESSPSLAARLFVDYEACDDSCEACAADGSCLACAAGLIFSTSGQCVPSCSDGQIIVDGRCQGCHASCDTCSGVTAADCTACVQHMTLSEMSGVCASISCNETQYLDGNGLCQDCHQNCTVCYGPNADECTLCYLPLVLQGSSCVEECDAGFHADGTGICQPCHTTCSECSGPRPDDCTACPTHQVLSQGRCVDSCPSRSFVAPLAGELQCQSCDQSCVNCYGGASDQCLSCNNQRFLSVTELQSTCTLGCSGPFAPSPVTRTCESCGANCRQCIAADGLSCIDCELGSNTFLHAGVCVSSCPDGSYPDAFQRRCADCDETCLTCTGPGQDQCVQCQSGLYLQNGTCVAQCQERFFPAPDAAPDGVSPRLCQPCDSTCLQCDGPSPSHCTACPDGLFLSKDGRCVANCRAEGYADEETRTCKPCAPSCLTCDGPLDSECLSCKALDLLQGTVCVQDCSDGFYLDSNSGTCQACASNCQACEDTPAKCTACSGNRFLSGTSCVPECPDTFYPDMATRECRSCHSSCRSCENDQPDACTTCLDVNEVVLDGVCQPSCGPGMFSADGVCYSCHMSCASCQGGESNDCTSCRPGLALVAGECVSGCPAGFHNASGICEQCPVHCTDCVAADKCGGCRGLLEYNAQGVCVDDCGEDRFGDGESFSCLECHASCLRCSGPSDTECTVCPDGFWLQDGRCLSDCTQGYFKYNPERRCLPCHGSCAACDGPGARDCTECHSSQPYLLDTAEVMDVLTGTVSSNVTCVSQCPNRTFASESRQECTRCHETCETCSSSGSGACLSCPASLKYYLGKCLSDCPDGTYLTSHGECSPCHSSCATCTGATEFECDDCPEGILLYINGPDRECRGRCPKGSYADGDKCKGCPEGCSACTSKNVCTECETGLLSDTECVSVCPPAQYADRSHGLCIDCPTGSTLSPDAISCVCDDEHVAMQDRLYPGRFECLDVEIAADFIGSGSNPYLSLVVYSFGFDFDAVTATAASESDFKESVLDAVPQAFRPFIWHVALQRGSVRVLLGVTDSTMAALLASDVPLVVTFGGSTNSSVGRDFILSEETPIQTTTTTSTSTQTTTTVAGGQQTDAPSADDDNIVAFAGAGAGAGAFIVFAVIFVVAYRHHLKSKRNKTHPGADSRHSSMSSIESFKPAFISLQRGNSMRRSLSAGSYSSNYSDGYFEVPPTQTAALFSTVTRVTRELPRESITLGKKLGAGAFGEVYKGTLDFGQTVEVAIKTLRAGAGEGERASFLQEAAIMGQFHHSNVLKLYGVCTSETPEKPILLVTELMSEGELEGFLKRIRPTEPMTNRKLLKRFGKVFIKMALDISRGMAYLSHKKFVHRDLAARNILVHFDGTCKVADFGLSADVADGAYEVSADAKVPIKWTAPEAVASRRYTSSADMWSYGVVLFEIWAFAQRPYGKWKNGKVLREVRKGYRLPPPPGVPLAIYELMIDAWNPTEADRPSFRAAVRRLMALKTIAERDVRSLPLGTPQVLYDLQSKYKRAASEGAAEGQRGSASTSMISDAIPEDDEDGVAETALPGQTHETVPEETNLGFDEEDLDDGDEGNEADALWDEDIIELGGDFDDDEPEEDEEEDEVEELNPEFEQEA